MLIDHHTRVTSNIGARVPVSLTIECLIVAHHTLEALLSYLGQGHDQALFEKMTDSTFMP